MEPTIPRRVTWFSAEAQVDRDLQARWQPQRRNPIPLEVDRDLRARWQSFAAQPPIFLRLLLLLTRRGSCIAAAVFLLTLACLLSGCGTSGHRLPPYERPIARTEYQSVRTTAYTHTEADHLAYGNHNALGGTLHAAPYPSRLTYAAEAIPVSNPQDIVDEQGGFHRQPFLDRPVAPMGGHLPPGNAAADASSSIDTAPPASYGSAAADWSRWPAGTIFRIESTGQLYRVDDYGWALSGRNTIDLYESTRANMNAWGVRQVPIHVLHWGSREESLRRLRNHQGYKHIRRMVFELEGKTRAAARLE